MKGVGGSIRPTGWRFETPRIRARPVMLRIERTVARTRALLSPARGKSELDSTPSAARARYIRRGLPQAVSAALLTPVAPESEDRERDQDGCGAFCRDARTESALSRLRWGF